MVRKLWKIIGNIRVGKRDVAPDATAHVKGVRQGNITGSFEKQEGFYWKRDAALPDPGGRDAGGMAVANSRRSTGITPEASNPIDPDMPNLTPP